MVLQRNRALMLLSIYNQCTQVSFTKTSQIHKRTMMSSRSIYVARAVYHGLNALVNSSVIDNVTKNDHTPLVKSLVDHGLDHTQGTPQHKGRILTSLSNHKFSGKMVYQHFTNKTGIAIACSDMDTDLRVLKEIAIIPEYHGKFCADIVKIQANLDNVPGNFHAQKQKNHDFWVDLKSAVKNAATPKIIMRQQDEKAGTHMFEHSTRGTLGLLTYDSATKENVQIMTSTYSIDALLEIDKMNFESIKNGLKADKLYEKPKYKHILTKGDSILRNTHDLSFEDKLKAHDEYQQYLWDNFQRDVEYPRSISFIFPKIVTYNHPTEQDIRFQNFRKEFSSLLQDRPYNIDKRGDCRDISIAMLIAYKNNVDPLILDKIRHLRFNVGITFNSNFLLDLAKILKDNML